MRRCVRRRAGPGPQLERLRRLAQAPVRGLQSFPEPVQAVVGPANGEETAVRSGEAGKFQGFP